MRLIIALCVVTVLGLSSPESSRAQAAHRMILLKQSSALTTETTLQSLVIPDSVRRKVGYQHWKGGAIGGAVGAVAGLVLGLVGHRCADCSSDGPVLLEASLVGAGLGGAFGFLVGAATPKYRWEATPAGTMTPASSD